MSPLGIRFIKEGLKNMKKLLPLLLGVCLYGWGQTTPTTGVWTQLGSANGYRDFTIGQFDEATIMNGVYYLWGEYLTQTFSEENDNQAGFEYASNRWQYLNQASSWHSAHRSQTGHQWGYQFIRNGVMYTVANSGAQGLEEMWVLNACDLGAWGTCYDIPLFQTGVSTLTRPWISGGGTLSGYGAYDSHNDVVIFFPDSTITSGNLTVCSIGAMTCTAYTGLSGAPAATQAVSNFRFDPDNNLTYFYPGNGTSLYSINGASPSSGWTSYPSATCTGGDCVFTGGSIGHPPARNASGLAYTTTDHLFLFTGGVQNGSGLSVTLTASSPVINGTNTFVANQVVEFTSGIAAPFVIYQNYYVLATGLSGSQFELATTPGGTAINAGANATNSVTVNYQDVWTFSATANGGLGAWVEVCGLNATGGLCSVPFPTFTIIREGDRLQYDSNDNVFMIADDFGVMWTYAYSAATGAFGRTCQGSTSCYGIPAPTGNVKGPWNRTTPPVAPNTSNAQTGAFDLSVDVVGGNIYIPSVQPGIPGTTGSCLFPVAYLGYLSSGSVTFMPPGTQATACGAIGNGVNNQPSGHPFHAQLSGIDFEVHDKRNWAGQSSNGKAVIQACSTVGCGSGATWSGGDVGCFTATCFNSGTLPQNSPRGLLNVNGTLMALTVETLSTFNQLSDVFLASCTTPLTSGVNCTSVTSTTPLNYVASSYVTGAAFATDGSGNVFNCWTEEVDASTRVTMTVTPQAKCKYYNGSAISVVGTGANSGSLNQSTGSWARDPSVVYGGGWWFAYTEQTRTGIPKLYAENCPVNGTACTSYGPLNLGSGDLAFGPSLVADGSTLYLGFGDQSAVGSKTLGAILKWNGSAWSTFQTGIINDGTNGNLIDIKLAVPSSGNVTAVWTEGSYGNTPQIFSENFTSAPTFSTTVTVQEALFPGAATTGITRTNEPVTVGIPVPDSVGLMSTSNLGLTGATAGQFTVENTWPDGNIKWVKIRAIVGSVPGGGSTSLTFSNSGSGNFGGTNLATDNGTTITVSTNGGTCGAGTAICFTVKKLNFDLIDQMQIGATTLVSSGASLGIVALGPSPTATYPGNVTCSPTSGGSTCNTVYATANDGANSTCAIEENGPAIAVLKCSADLNDGAGHVYMHTTSRLYFYQGSSKIKATVELRNADFGTGAVFATAYKGIQALEARIVPTLSGSLTYQLGATTCPSGVCSGTMTGGTGDYAYVYGSEFDWMQWGGDYITPNCPATPTYGRCVHYSSLQGYTVNNSISSVPTVQATGTFTQYPSGWMDVSNGSGVGVEMGQYEMAGFGNESEEARSGGEDLRVGMWAAENNTTSVSEVTCNPASDCQPYYMAYPEYSTHEIYLNFHATAPASLANEFYKQQYYLVGRAPITWYNSAGVFYYPLEDPTEESNFYTQAMSAFTPVVGSSPVSPTNYQDLGAVSTNYWPLLAYKFYNWQSGGSGNQSELRLSELFNFIRRGHTGEYLNASHFYELIAELGLPRADGFSWALEAGTNTNYYNYPVITDGNSNSNALLGMKDWIGDDFEHAHIYGIIDYYLMSGDETIKDAIINGYPDTFLNTVSNNNMINAMTNSTPAYMSQRSLGNVLMGVARLANFETSLGNTSTAASLLGRGNTVWTTGVKAPLCVSSAGSNDPTGCTLNLSATWGTYNAFNLGTTPSRGVTFQRGPTASGTCSFGTGAPRELKAIFLGPMSQGLWEFRQEEGSGYADYNAIYDAMFGLMQMLHGTSGMGGSNFGEMYADDGTNVWNLGNGMRYGIWLDGANAPGGSACQPDYPVLQPGCGSLGCFDAFWPNYWAEGEYLGQTQTNLKRQIQMMVESVMGSCSPSSCSEIWHYTIGRLIYLLNHPPSYALITTPITAFTNNGGGSYTLSWTVPTGAQSYRMKWNTSTIVDYIGYNDGTASWVGNPANANWWSSTDLSGIPSPGVPGTTQSQTFTGLSSSSLSVGNFMIKSNASPQTQTFTPGSVISHTLSFGGTVRH